MYTWDFRLNLGPGGLCLGTLLVSLPCGCGFKHRNSFKATPDKETKK